MSGAGYCGCWRPETEYSSSLRLTTTVEFIGNRSSLPAWSMCRCVCATKQHRAGAASALAATEFDRDVPNALPQRVEQIAAGVDEDGDLACGRVQEGEFALGQNLRERDAGADRDAPPPRRWRGSASSRGLGP